MTINTQINLEQLFDQLRLNGITIGAIEIRHLQRIFKTSPHLSRAELSDLLCTVLALDNNQQNTIQRIFQSSIPFDNDSLESHSDEKSTTPHDPTHNHPPQPHQKNKQNKTIKKNPLNIGIIGLLLLTGISLLLAIFTWQQEPPKVDPSLPPDIVQGKVPPPEKTQDTDNSPQFTIKVIRWTGKISHIEYLHSWQRLLSPLLLMLGGSLGLILLLHRAKKYTRRSPDTIVIIQKREYYPAKQKSHQNYYLLSSKQRHAMGWGINHYLSDQNLQQIDIKKTVESSAKQGLPSIRFKQVQLQREVWLWIDQSSSNADLFQLSQEIKNTLQRLNIDVQLNYFNTLPSQVFTANGKLIWSYQQEPAEHKPLVAVLMDSDNINTAHQHQTAIETKTLRSLAEWQSLCLIDCNPNAGQLEAIAHSVNQQLCVLLPQNISNWLSQQGENQSNPPVECPLSDLYRWVCACALPNHPLKEEQVRRLHEALGLDCAWQFSSLQRYNQGAPNQLNFLNNRPQHLRDIQPDDLKKARVFWQNYYQEYQYSLEKNSRQQQKAKLNIALLQLWESKDFDQTVTTLHNYYKNKYLRGEVESQLRQYTCSGLAHNVKDKGNDIEGILLPHSWHRIKPKTRSLLLSMGFGGKIQQSMVQWDKATATLLGLFGGVMLLGLVWSVQVLIPQTTQLKTLIHSAKPIDEAKQLVAFEKTLIANQIMMKVNTIAWVEWTQHIHFKKREKRNTISLDNNLQLIAIPLPKSGFFMMGSDIGSDNEKPVHKVKLSQPFLMAQTEITFAQYDAFTLATGGKQAEAEWGREKMPVINVSWQDAKNYIQWINKTYKSPLKGLQCRLPSEAEWEYAARAGTTTEYPWGNKIGKNKANCSDCGSQWDKQTAPVASFSANPFGLYDMNGNAWEWVEDRWHENYQGAPTEGQAWLKGSDKSRVLRGGSWLSSSNFLRSASRVSNNSDYRFNLIGFRIVCSHPFTEN